MQIPINVDQLQAVQAIGSGSPIGSISFKLGNIPSFEFYFASGAVVQDYGSGTAIRFGMVAGQNAAAGPLLVEETTFTRQVDDSNRVFYQGFPNFDTDLLIAALASNYSILCSGEVRWQRPDGSVDRTLDLLFTIIRPIIPETAIDTLASGFTVPAINSDVAVVIGDTGWLRLGQLVTIATAGVYAVHTITNATTFEGTNTGATGNAAAATTITAPQVVGSTPPTIPNSFPDPSTLELLIHKGVASGYADLDVDALLPTARLPVVPLANIPTGVELSANRNAVSGYAGTDSQGLVSADAIPADGSTLVVISVPITRTGTTASGSAIVTGLSGTSDLTLLEPVTGAGIPGATTLLSIDSSSQITLSANATASASVPLTFTTQKLSAVGPAQGVISITASDFTVPTVGSNVTINTPTTGLTAGLYYTLSGGAGSYQYVSATDTTHGVFTNLGGAQNSPATTTISFPVNIAWSGPPGQGSGGGLSCEVAVAFTLPSVGTNLNVTVDNGNPFTGGVAAIVVPGSTTNYGYWMISAVDSTHINLANDSRLSAANAGATLPVGARIILIDLGIAPSIPSSSLNGFIETPTAKTYTVQLAVPAACTAFNFTIQLASGTCTAALNKNGAAMSGCSAIAVTSTIQTISVLDTLAVTDKLELVISSPTSPVDLSYTLSLLYS